MAAPRCHGPRSRGSHARTTALPFNDLFLFPFFRCARPRGGGRGFRLPLPRSGLRCPVFASGVVAPSQKADRCPCSASAVSAAGSASASQPLDSLPSLTTSPLALSRFLRRAAEGACKNRSAAPASARLFRPLDAPGQSCPGPKRGSRGVQKPKKHCHAWPVETFRASNGGTGVFLNGFCPPLRLVPHARPSGLAVR